MPVRKFRSVDEMNRAAWYPVGSPELARAMAAVWGLGRRMTRPPMPTGVRKFRTIEELKRARADAQR